MEKTDKQFYEVSGRLLRRLIQRSYTYQGEIYHQCDFQEKDEDARVALFGFIRGELLATYFSFVNLADIIGGNFSMIETVKRLSGEISVPNESFQGLLVSHLRRDFTNNIYFLLESANRQFSTVQNFNVYLQKFDPKLVNGFLILRHLRNSVHSNGTFQPANQKDFKCNYRGYQVEYKCGDFVKTNIAYIYWIVTDSLSLFKEMALENLQDNNFFHPIDQNYNILKMEK